MKDILPFIFEPLSFIPLRYIKKYGGSRSRRLHRRVDLSRYNPIRPYPLDARDNFALSSKRIAAPAGFFFLT